MSSSMDYHVATAKAIAAKAESENRALSKRELEQVESHIAAVNEEKRNDLELKARKAGMSLQEFHENELRGILSRSEVSGQPGSLGQKIVNELGSAMKGKSSSDTPWTTGAVEVAYGRKLQDGGSNDVVSITGADGNLPLQPQVIPILGPVEQKLYVADLFGSGVATQNTVVYLEETTTDPGALDSGPYNSDASSRSAVLTSEGSDKPAAFIDFTKQEVHVDKIAAFLPISDETMEDEVQITSYINSRLPLFIRQAEEAFLVAQILANAGSAASSDVDGNNLYDAIAAGQLAVAVNGGLEADAVLINPADFYKMIVRKAGTDSSGQYFSGSPFAAAPRTPWGIRAVVTSAVAAGSPVVGAFRDGATLYRKGGLRVEASNSHEDYFRRNLTALRAEERIALALLRPQAFVNVTDDSS